MSLLILLIIVVAIICALKQTSSDPDNTVVEVLQELRRINKRVTLLEAEIRKLKRENFSESQNVSETISEDKDISLYEFEAETKKEESHFEESIEKNVQAYAPQEAKEIIQKSLGEASQIKQDEKTVDLESFFTTNLINKIGAIALIIGMGFFLKYAFDNNWISPVFQMFTGFAVAIGLLFGASSAQKTEKYKVFSQGIAGAGIAISYLTIYSGYNFYQLFNEPIAFSLMLITTVVAFVQAVKYDSLATAVLAIIGGFLTPVLIQDIAANSLGILTYWGFLNVLAVSLLHKKNSWNALGILCLFLTYINYFTIHFNSYNSPSTLASITFLVIIWALYFIFDVSKIKDKSYNYNFLNFQSGTLFYIAVYNLYCDSSDSLVFTTFLISFAYLLVGMLVYFKYNKLDKYLKQNFYIFATLFAFATNLATEGLAKPALFAVEAFMLLYFGTYLEKGYVQKFSTIFFTMSYFTLLGNTEIYSTTSAEAFIPIFNLRDLTILLIISLVLLSAKILKKETENSPLISFFRYSWTCLLFIFLTLEVNDLVSKIAAYTTSQTTQSLILFNKNMVQVMIWSLYSSRLIAFGINNKIKPFTVIGTIGSFIAIIALFATGMNYYPHAKYIPVFNLRFIAFVFSALNMMFISKLLKKHNMQKDIQDFLNYAWGVLLFLLINFEIKDYFSNFNSVMQLVLSTGWLFYSIAAMFLGIVKQIKPLRKIALIVLGLTILKVFIFDLSFLDQLGRIVSFIGLGVILLILSFYYQKYSIEIKELINNDSQN